MFVWSARGCLVATSYHTFFLTFLVMARLRCVNVRMGGFCLAIYSSLSRSIIRLGAAHSRGWSMAYLRVVHVCVAPELLLLLALGSQLAVRSNAVHHHRICRRRTLLVQPEAHHEVFILRRGGANLQRAGCVARGRRKTTSSTNTSSGHLLIPALPTAEVALFT